MYDSISSNVWRMGRRRWYVIVLCALLGAGAGLALGSSGGGDISGRFDIRVASLGDLASILDIDKEDDVSLTQIAAQAAIDFELSDANDNVTATFLGNEEARVLRVTVVGDTAADVDAAATAINGSVTSLVVAPRLDQVEVATGSRDSQIDIFKAQRDQLDASIDALAVDDPLRPTLLLQRSEIDREIASAGVDRANLVSYGDFVESNLLATDATKYTNLRQGPIAIIVGAIVGVILALLGMVVAVLLDRRVRRRIHIEEAAPTAEVLTVTTSVGSMTSPEQDTFRAAVDSFVERHMLAKLVVVVPSTGSDLRDLLGEREGCVMTFTDVALPDSSGPRPTGYLLVARWGRSSHDQVSAAVASLGSAGTVAISAVLVDVPRPDLDWAGVSSSGRRTETV